MQTYPGLVTFFYQFFLAFQRRKNLVFCFVSGDCSQILHLVFWCCRYFLSREEKTSTQAGARLCNNLWLWCKRAFVHQKGSLFGSWCTPWCREYGPLVRSCGCRCKLKLPVWCLAESWIWCVHQSHHHSPGQLLHQGGFKESVKLLKL